MVRETPTTGRIVLFVISLILAVIPWAFWFITGLATGGIFVLSIMFLCGFLLVGGLLAWFIVMAVRSGYRYKWSIWIIVVGFVLPALATGALVLLIALAFAAW
jgi:hypothetical protein